MDTAARLLNAQIIVCQKDPATQNNKKVYVEFNGRDHFIELQENPAYAKNLASNLRQLTTFNITVERHLALD